MSLLTHLQHSPLLFLIAIGVLGMLVGSFLNVVIHRLPIMMQREWRAQCCELLEIKDKEQSSERFDLFFPRSRCPHCSHQLKMSENIPVASYLFLHGKCSECSKKISIRYPLIEIISAASAMIVAWHFGFSMQALFAILLTWALICLTMIDFDQQLLPDDITLPFLWLGIICNMFGLYTDIISSLFGVIIGYLVFWLIYVLFKQFTGKEGMGHGDFKLLAMFGAWLGWQQLPLIIILSSVVGALVGVSLLLFTSHKRTQPIPFGPYIAIAGWIALLWGEDITRQYLLWSTAG